MNPEPERKGKASVRSWYVLLTGTEWHWARPLLHQQYSTRLLLSIGRNHDWCCW